MDTLVRLRHRENLRKTTLFVFYSFLFFLVSLFKRQQQPDIGCVTLRVSNLLLRPFLTEKCCFFVLSISHFISALGVCVWSWCGHAVVQQCSAGRRATNRAANSAVQLRTGSIRHRGEVLLFRLHFVLFDENVW